MDTWRGVAVLLMLLDHFLIFDGSAAAWWMRHTVTRAAFPLFFGLAGYLWKRQVRRRWSWRFGRVLIAAGFSSMLAVWAGLPMPGVLTQYCAAWLISPLICWRPLIGVVVGVLQVTVLPCGWRGYEPGLAMCFTCIGVVAFDTGGHWSFSCSWLAWLGRHALAVFCAQELALAIAVKVLKG